MLTDSLYNGRNFPEYVFSEEVKSYVFVEFDFVFTEDFWNIFNKYLLSVKIEYLVVENLVPDYLFRKRINVVDLPESFIRIACTENLEGYFPNDRISLQVLTEKALICPEEGEKHFCILLDREYEIAVIGFSSSQVNEAIVQFAIHDLSSYLTLAFAGKELPGVLINALKENWKVL